MKQVSSHGLLQCKNTTNGRINNLSQIEFMDLQLGSTDF